MPARLVLLRHVSGTDDNSALSEDGFKQAAHASHGLAAYLGLTSKFSPKPAAFNSIGQDVIIVNSGAAPAVHTAGAVRDALVMGGMLLRGDSADADALGPDVDPAVAIQLMNQISVAEKTRVHRLTVV
jgi:hypothetical protein